MALKDILALKLCDRCEHSEHKLASGRGCVDGLLAADKLDLFLGQAFYKIEQVAGIAGETANGLNNYCIAAPDVIHHAGEFRPVGVLAADFVDENLVNAELAQQNFLPSGVLIFRADTDVAYFQICHSVHCNRVTLHSAIFQKP